MGALEIRSRSATLGNLGGIREVNTNTGALEGANRVAASVRELGRARISAAEAEGRGWAALGRGIASLSGFADIAADYMREDERRKADEYANKYQARMVLHNYGGGQGAVGAMNETISESDRGQWMEANNRAARRIHDEVLKDMGLTRAEFKGTRMEKWLDQYLFKQGARWEQKRGAAMAAYRRQEADKAYENARNDVTDDMVSEDGWKKLDEAMERKIAVNGWGPEAAAAFRRKEGETIWGIGIKKALDEAMAEAEAAGADGGKVFDRLKAAWEGGGDNKPTTTRESGGDNKPTTTRGESGGDNKPTTTRGGGGDNKPTTARESGGDNKPTTASLGGEDNKPTTARGGGGLTVDSLTPPGSTYAVRDEKGKVVERNPLKEWTKGADFKAIKRAALESLDGYKERFERERHARVASEQKANSDALTAEMRKRASGMVDTKVAMAGRGSMEEPEAYALRIDRLVEAEKLDAKSGEAFKKAYRQMLDQTDYVIGEAQAGRGVWVKVKGRDGKAMEVFRPDRLGNGKTETDADIAAKYTLVGRDGKTPYMDDPGKGMEELDYDLRMGNISVPFYNAQMGRMRVFSDTKAKEAFVRIFGASPDIFTDKDVEAYLKRGIDTDTKDVYAKNRWWAGNHQIGKRDATWQEDALKKDGGETKIGADQQAQIYEIILDLTAQGVDPTKAIEAYLAPTIRGWMNTDLEERINPDRKIGGKSFREWVLESDRFNAGNRPAEREARLRARQKRAYGDAGDAGDAGDGNR